MENESARADDLQINSATMPSSRSEPSRVSAPKRADSGTPLRNCCAIYSETISARPNTARRWEAFGAGGRPLTTPRPRANKPAAAYNRSCYWFTVVSVLSPVIGASPHSFSLNLIPQCLFQGEAMRLDDFITRYSRYYIYAEILLLQRSCSLDLAC